MVSCFGFPFFSRLRLYNIPPLSSASPFCSKISTLKDYQRKDLVLNFFDVEVVFSAQNAMFKPFVGVYSKLFT